MVVSVWWWLRKCVLLGTDLLCVHFVNMCVVCSREQQSSDLQQVSYRTSLCSPFYYKLVLLLLLLLLLFGGVCYVEQRGCCCCCCCDLTLRAYWFGFGCFCVATLSVLCVYSVCVCVLCVCTVCTVCVFCVLTFCLQQEHR